MPVSAGGGHEHAEHEVEIAWFRLTTTTLREEAP